MTGALVAAAALVLGAPQDVVSVRGVGAIEIGMTQAQAERAADVALVGSAPGRACRYVHPRGAVPRFELMLVRDRVVRVDVARRGLRTTGGLRVGDSEAAVRRRFGDRLRIAPAKYVPGGRELEVQPSGRRDRNRRLVFETDGRRITGVRAGRLPEVRYVERCG